jgi:hypothetical protein
MNYPLRAVQIIKGPYLQNVAKNAVTIMWETDASSKSTVEYGLSSSYGKSETLAEPTTIHTVRLSGLETETEYHYRGVSGDAVSEDITFRTAVHDNTPFRFALWGDSRSGTDRFRSLLSEIINRRPNIVLTVGDLVDEGGKYSQWGSMFFTPAYDLIKNTCHFAAKGDHEYYGGGIDHWYEDFFSNPNIAGHSKTYYSFNYGNSHFIVLNNIWDTYGTIRSPFNPGSQQHTWLMADLASPACQAADWVFVFFHRPPWSQTGGYSCPKTQEYLVPILSGHPVDMVFMGHSHNYQRYDTGGVHYVISGGGGTGLYSMGSEWDFIEITHRAHHFCQVDIDGRTLAFKAVDAGGMVIDSMGLTKQVSRNSWEHPVRPLLNLEVVPNPFMGGTAIGFGLAEMGQVSLEIFDLRGKLVCRPVQGELSRGYHVRRWHANDGSGSRVSNGVYICTLKQRNRTFTRRMLFIK